MEAVLKDQGNVFSQMLLEVVRSLSESKFASLSFFAAKITCSEPSFALSEKSIHLATKKFTTEVILKKMTNK